jgi:D-alanyl-D-alanine carboxypeptidase
MRCCLLFAVGCWLLAGRPAAFSQTIPAQIDSILARAAVAANSWTILVENADGSVIHYQRNPTTGLAPASNTKMFTTAAAFGLLGTNYAFPTRLYRDGTLSGGVLTGNLNLVSEHDPTWNTSVFSGNARKPLDTIAASLKALGLTSVTGNVQCYGLCAYGLGSTANLSGANTQTRNATAATNFVAALQAQGITVSGVPAGQTGFSPPGTLLHTYYSTNNTYGGKPLRLDVACIPLMKVSHNVMADALLRHIGWKLTGTDSYTAGRNQVVPWLRNVAGLTTNGIAMNDGSGLSWNNRFSARQTVGLTRYMLAAFPSWNTTLPIGCVDGTISSRFCGTDGSGQVRAKTGSLGISIALSGYIDNKHDGQRYLFSYIGNNSAGIDQSATRQAIDDCVVLSGARGVPFSPQLWFVRNTGSGLALAWSNDDFVRTGYRVYASSDGLNFGAPMSVGASTHSFMETGLPVGVQRYYKVSVVGSGGESKPSRIYGAQVGATPSPVLLVDGNDRWQFQTTENPAGTNHAFATLAGRSVSGPAFDTAHHNAVISGLVPLTNHPAVVWLLGEESTVDETFNATERALVTDYLNAGGNLFVSGAEIGWHLDRASGPTAAERHFYRTVLRAAYAADDANTYAFAPGAGGIFAGNPAGGFDNGTRGTYNVDFPDVLAPTNGSIVALTYTGGTGGAAAVQFDGAPAAGKVMNWGFPFETITNATTRTAYMSDVLRWFGVIEPPRMLPPQLNLAANSLTLTWTASAGLRYRVQFKANLADAPWHMLGADVTATNTFASQVDTSAFTVPRRFYRVLLLD